MIMLDAMKRSACMNQCRNPLEKLVEATSNPPNDRMDSDDPFTPLIQFLLSLSTNIIKEYYQHIGGKMGEFHDQKKKTIMVAIVWKWGERIWVRDFYYEYL